MNCEHKCIDCKWTIIMNHYTDFVIKLTKEDIDFKTFRYVMSHLVSKEFMETTEENWSK